MLRAEREAVIAAASIAASNRYHRVLPCASPSAKLQLSISAPSDVDLASRHVKLDAVDWGGDMSSQLTMHRP